MFLDDEQLRQFCLADGNICDVHGARNFDHECAPVSKQWDRCPSGAVVGKRGRDL